MRAVDYFLSSPPSTPQKAAFFSLLPSLKVSHTARQNTEGHGREERIEGGRERHRGERKGRGANVAGENTKCVPVAFKTC